MNLPTNIHPLSLLDFSDRLQELVVTSLTRACQADKDLSTAHFCEARYTLPLGS